MSKLLLSLFRMFGKKKALNIAQKFTKYGASQKSKLLKELLTEKSFKKYTTSKYMGMRHRGEYDEAEHFLKGLNKNPEKHYDRYARKLKGLSDIKIKKGPKKAIYVGQYYGGKNQITLNPKYSKSILKPRGEYGTTGIHEYKHGGQDILTGKGINPEHYRGDVLDNPWSRQFLPKKTKYMTRIDKQDFYNVDEVSARLSELRAIPRADYKAIIQRYLKDGHREVGSFKQPEYYWSSITKKPEKIPSSFQDLVHMYGTGIDEIVIAGGKTGRSLPANTVKSTLKEIFKADKNIYGIAGPGIAGLGITANTLGKQ